MPSPQKKTLSAYRRRQGPAAGPNSLAYIGKSLPGARLSESSKILVASVAALDNSVAL
jgi:hypothetical protein